MEKPPVMKCETCKKELEVPLCCNEFMVLKDKKLVCSLCSAQESLEVCCGKEMQISS